MYAAAHVTVALAAKKKVPSAPLFPMMVAVQASELVWILLSYLGVEHILVDKYGVLHLDFLAYSHSVASALAIGVLGWGILALYFGKPKLGALFGLLLMSHVALDIVQHEPNIQLAPGIYHPLLGLGLQAIPALDFVVELGLGIGCWYYFGGGWKLLAAIVGLNLTNLPLMFSPAGSAYALATNHYILPTIVLAQTLMAWGLIYLFARARAAQLSGTSAESAPRMVTANAPV